MNKVSLAWAEDHQRFRSAIIKLLASESNWLELIFTTSNGIDMLKMLEGKNPDIVLLDIRMPEMDGITTAKIIYEKYPDMKIIAFTEFDYENNIIEMCKVGVKSFVLKSKTEELVRAIKIVSGGGVYFPDEIAGILQHLLKSKASETEDVPLNEFENRLLRAIYEGKSSTQIGKEVSLSPRTVEEHREKLYKKFNVKNKLELVVKAIQKKLVKIP